MSDARTLMVELVRAYDHYTCSVGVDGVEGLRTKVEAIRAHLRDTVEPQPQIDWEGVDVWNLIVGVRQKETADEAIETLREWYETR